MEKLFNGFESFILVFLINVMYNFYINNVYNYNMSLTILDISFLKESANFHNYWAIASEGGNTVFRQAFLLRKSQ